MSFCSNRKPATGLRASSSYRHGGFWNNLKSSLMLLHVNSSLVVTVVFETTVSILIMFLNI